MMNYNAKWPAVPFFPRFNFTSDCFLFSRFVSDPLLFLSLIFFPSSDPSSPYLLSRGRESRAGLSS